MNIVEKPIADLTAYENNPKIHTEKQIQQIMKSITLTHGLRQPIVIDADNVVVCGHGRLLAAQRLGMVSVPCELVDDLTEDEIRAYRLVDNEIAKGDTDWDLFNEELEKIEDVDMSDFDIDIPDSISIGGMDDDLIDKPIDDRDPSCQHNVFENQEIMQFPILNYYGIPVLRPTKTTGDKFLRFMDWKECPDPENYIAHFYYDDYKFIAAWREPNKYIDRLRKFKAVVTPNFSTYTDFPKALQILACYRSNWCGAYWQMLGLDVIPDVCWGDRDSYDFCFEGIPKGGTVAISSVSVANDPLFNGKEDTLFKDGFDEMMNRIHPSTILMYGSMIDGLNGNIINIPSYYAERRDNWGK